MPEDGLVAIWKWQIADSHVIGPVTASKRRIFTRIQERYLIIAEQGKHSINQATGVAADAGPLQGCGCVVNADVHIDQNARLLNRHITTENSFVQELKLEQPTARNLFLESLVLYNYTPFKWL